MSDDRENLEWTDLDRRAVDTARVLAADAVEKVGNGHPGTAMSLAPVAYLLFQKIMRQDPSDDRWTGRDRFILSPGHTSLTQYIQLYLGGYGLELEDLQALRTWGSLTPGHPEYKHTRGVEITTGPLGQGLASAVGFAYAQRYLRGLLDPDTAPGRSPFDHTVFTIASDGDLEEGVTSEASSLAGHQQLGNLVVIYDQNQISIEDDTDVAFTEDVAERYRAYGWDVRTVDWRAGGEYREDVQALYDAIQEGRKVTDKPTFISLRTIIGWPAPTKQNTGGIHGSKLGADEVRAGRSDDSPAQVFLDLALPRDVDPAVGDLAGVEAFWLDDLRDLPAAVRRALGDLDGHVHHDLVVPQGHVDPRGDPAGHLELALTGDAHDPLRV